MTFRWSLESCETSLKDWKGWPKLTSREPAGQSLGTPGHTLASLEQHRHSVTSLLTAALTVPPTRLSPRSSVKPVGAAMSLQGRAKGAP